MLLLIVLVLLLLLLFGFGGFAAHLLWWLFPACLIVLILAAVKPGSVEEGTLLSLERLGINEPKTGLELMLINVAKRLDRGVDDRSLVSIMPGSAVPAPTGS
jgi:hypothetical protein